MPDWLTKAQATITGGRFGSDDFQPFERQCVCGEILCGERMQSAQQIVCPQCERSWFVLPRDPYPRLKTRRAKSTLWKRWGSRSSSETAGAHATNAPGGPGVSQKTATIASDRTREVPRRSPSVPLRQRMATRIAASKAAARERLRKAARPMRLVAAGILAALLVTGFWLWQRARIDAASATIVSLEPQAEQAVADRDFASAEKLFTELVAAVDTLGATDQTAQRVRQRHRESIAINNLAAQSPYDLAAEADKFVANSDEWTDRFRAVSAGRWVVLDVNVSPSEPSSDVSDRAKSEEPREDEAPREELVVLDLPLVVGKFPVRFEMNASLFKGLKLPARVIVAAQYTSWRLQQDGKTPPVWVVRFTPESAFLWASSDTYAALGFDLDAVAAPPRAVLEQQAKLLGLEVERDRPQAVEAESDRARER